MQQLFPLKYVQKLTKLVISGLAGEKIRWEASAENLEVSMGFLVGDCLVASAFLSYMGPFLSNYRDEMVENIWLKQVINFLIFFALPKLIPFIDLQYL